jgi:hypothetical protein
MIRFIYKNYWRNGTILAQSSEHPQFPADNTQDDLIQLVWQARHGAGTGNGRFVVGNTNKYIDFDEGGAELTATITPATYTAQTLCAEIKTRMDAAGGTYTVSYSETTGKFTIAGTGNFTLRWHDGANQANTAALLLGFIKASHYTGAATYTGDNVSIHTSEEIDNDFGSALEYDFVSILGHNLTSVAVIKIIGADDSAFTTNVVTDTLTWAGNNIYEFLGTARTKRYCRFYIEDTANPSMYAGAGVIVVGKYVSPNRHFGPNSSGTVDESETEKAPSGNMFVVQEKAKFRQWEIPFKGLTDAADDIVELMRINNGVTKSLIMCIDPAAPNTTSFWVHFTETSLSDNSSYGFHNWTAILEETL